MIPRPRVTSIRADAPISELVEVMASGHSRLPVIGESHDDVVGVICLYLLARYRGAPPRWRGQGAELSHPATEGEVPPATTPEATTESDSNPGPGGPGVAP